MHGMSGHQHSALRKNRNKKSNPFLYPDITEDPWQDEANCKGKAFELFEYQEEDSPLAKDMDFKERYQFNKTNFELAAEICIECPVFFKCGEDASEDEKFWTVRQGEPPKRFVSDEYHAGVTGHEPRPKGVDKICSRGHAYKSGQRCPTCKRATNERYLKRVRELAARQAASDV